MDVLRQLAEAYLRAVVQVVLQLAEQAAGTEVLGSVPGRPEQEDVVIGVDERCDVMFKEAVADILDVRIHVVSEHGVYGCAFEEADYICAIDPFDGSGLFRRGVPAEWWSVLSFFDQAGNPVAAGAVDILRKKLYLALGNQVEEVSLEDDSRRLVFPAHKTAIDGETVIAGYLMDPGYLLEWVSKMRGLAERFPEVRFWPNGGSCIYPWLVRGVVHAYVMFREPRSEIDPGLGFASAAGIPVFSVSDDGELEPYRYDPQQQAEGRVPFFLAACTEELAREIVQVVLGR